MKPVGSRGDLMNKHIFIALLLVGSFLSAREINPLYPDFNHYSCFNRSINPSANHFRSLIQEALGSLVKMQSADIESQAYFSSLHPANKAYYLKLMRSVRSDGRILSSHELEKEMNLSGTCDSATDVLLDIIRNLK